MGAHNTGLRGESAAATGRSDEPPVSECWNCSTPFTGDRCPNPECREVERAVPSSPVAALDAIRNAARVAVDCPESERVAALIRLGGALDGYQALLSATAKAMAEGAPHGIDVPPWMAWSVWAEVRAERIRAHQKHGDTSMESSPADDPTGRRYRILVEEIGEVAKEFNDAEHDRRPVDLALLRKELVQVSAMAGAWADVCGVSD